MSSAGPVFNTPHARGNARITNISGNVTYVLSEEKAEKIYKWLDAPDSSDNFQAAREKHHGQTGTWFIEAEDYLRWKETPDSALWVYGTPGCGKTVICSTVVENIRAECAADPSLAYAYFFFDCRNAQTDLSLHKKLIRSIIKQLSHQSSGFPASLVELYGGGQEQPSIQSLQTALQKIMDGFERAYIIIDAVDECTDRKKVLVWIDHAIRRKTGKLQVLFSSRPERDIEDHLQSMGSLYRVTLNGKLADKDIETYLDAMLSKLTRWDKPTIARVKDALMAGSDGMFRWVALQISELCKCRTRRAVENQLRNLPKDLEGMYERSLLDSPHRQDLKRFLMWLAFSARPLEPAELADVVTVDLSSTGPPSYHSDLQYFGPTDMLITCSSFVTETKVDREDDQGKTIQIIKLAHMSVKDYLVSDQLKNGPASYYSIDAMLAHSLITKTCLGYVSHLGSLQDINTSVFESFPLGPYAARYWINHMRLGGGENEHLSQMMDSIFLLEESAMANWVRFDDPEQPEWFRTRASPEKRSAQIAAPLYYASIHGLQHIAQRLLIGGASVNARGGIYAYALQAASARGHHAVVRLLLEHGADVNAQGGQYGSALQTASWTGHDAIVRLLVEQGADVNAQGGQYGNALQAASWTGHDAIVRLLVGQGADVNTRGWCVSALQYAAQAGHETIVRLLLERGAAMNPHEEIGNALHAASEKGHDAVVRLLLKRGADVNAKGGVYGTALQAASARGHHAVVRLLLERGADVNLQGGLYNNAIEAARQGGHHEIWLRLLLAALGEEYGNRLQTAYPGDNDTTFQLLHTPWGGIVLIKIRQFCSRLKAAIRMPTLRDLTVTLLITGVFALLEWCIE